ncbi:hypothetical protein Plim_4260 (plasmid) [Planctopirus limnophila DSM 3776]|uniref:Uncharacterized protein n=1 Tax=Planctopirus limnophila (strain ATCC 43296 / DSM 3776 / IFAM 1008 / Mu 290) TaxID=521674 RepID=D5SZE7_PLAL2|nr:hypothetical protein [Planctopirus limnophila]ADG70067.1 hypothetical protein Plim_4260 [Planctopirus limnophila DSM 3776]
MKAKLIRDADGPNPDFDPKQKVSATNQPHVVIPKGTIIEGEKAFRLCQGSNPVAEPEDDDCKAVIAEYRKKRVAIHQQRAAERVAEKAAEKAETSRKGR